MVLVTNLDKNIDILDPPFKPIDESDRENMGDCRLAAPAEDPVRPSHTIDDAELYDGAHVAIQIVGRRLQEEKVLAIAEHIGSALFASKSDGESTAQPGRRIKIG